MEPLPFRFLVWLSHHQTFSLVSIIIVLAVKRMIVRNITSVTKFLKYIID